MSYVLFADRHEDVKLCGRERANMKVLRDELAMGVLSRLVGSFGLGDPPVLTVTKPGSWWHTRWNEYQGNRDSDPFRYTQIWERDALMGFRNLGSMLNEKVVLDGQEMNADQVMANTVLAMGGDELRLLCRIHGQCEEHSFIRGENRAWLADLIELGREKEIMRGPEILRGWGTWETVIEFLRRRDDETVVLSYSVTPTFPNREFCFEWLGELPGQPTARPSKPEGYTDEEWTEEDVDDAVCEMQSDWWYETLAHDEIWKIGLAALEAREAQQRKIYADYWTYEIRPHLFADFRFENGVTAFDLIAYATQKADVPV